MFYLYNIYYIGKRFFMRSNIFLNHCTSLPLTIRPFTVKICFREELTHIRPETRTYEDLYL